MRLPSRLFLALAALAVVSVPRAAAAARLVRIEPPTAADPSQDSTSQGPTSLDSTPQGSTSQGSTPQGPASQGSTPQGSTSQGPQGSTPRSSSTGSGTPAPGPAPAAHGAAAAPPPRLFDTSDRCMACHNFLFTPAGQDVSIGTAWRASIMANSARDPYWQAAVRRETVDHPEVAGAIEDECATCHMPMLHYEAHTRGGTASITEHLPVRLDAEGDDRLAGDGVSCSLCHQIEPDNFGQPQSFVGRFLIDTKTPWGERQEYGPFPTNASLTTIMKSSSRFTPVQGDHVRQSELCATCHTLYTSAFERGREIARLPEQVPYLEWLHGSFRDVQSCQDCHMQILAEPVQIASVLGPAEKGFAQHVFPGGNSFVLRMLNRYRNELGVEAVADGLQVTAEHTASFLRESAAELDLSATRGAAGLELDVTVENLTGHKLPTAYPARRVWIHLRVQDSHGTTVFESGRLEPSGAIVGNDNDDDALRYEPHHDVIDQPGQVQIYEDIMVGPRDEVTTGLTTAVRYIKDNRIPPEGFDKTTAERDFAVVGAALEDADFQGGSDVVHYRVPTGAGTGPFHVHAELWYQPIGFRWAHNHDRYPEPESQRFVRYYDAMSTGTAELMVEARATVK